MLFMVKTEIAQVPNIDRETFMDMVKEQWNYILSLKKEGKFLDAYRMSGRKGGIAIAEVSSHGELNKLLSKMPLYPWLDTEVVPLINMDDASSRAP